MSVLLIDDLKKHLNIIGHEDDTLLQLKLDAAEALVESYTGRKLIEFYDDAAQVYCVPAPVIEAALQIAGSLYENREGAPINRGTAELLAPFRMWSF